MAREYESLERMDSFGEIREIVGIARSLPIFAVY